MTTATRENRKRNTKAQSVASDLSGFETLGTLVTLGSKTAAETRTHKHADVVAALVSAGIDPKFARKFSNRQAFTRACRKLSDERIIDVVPNGNGNPDEIVFQFSVKHLGSGDEGTEMEYKKEAFVRLNTTTGKVTCKNKSLETQAQDLLDLHLEARTTSDVTSICHQVMQEHDQVLVPVPGSVGVFLVLKEGESEFTKVQKFLSALGRTPFTLPIPKGHKSSDENVAMSVEAFLEGMVEDLLTRAENFTVNTRTGTMEQQAEELKSIRVKCEAYAHYLGKKAKEVLAAIDDANNKLVKKIQEISEDKKNNPRAQRDFSSGKDPWGNYIGTQASEINLAFEQGATIEEVMTATGLTKTRVDGHVRYLTEKKLITRSGSKYTMVPQEG